jgi:hypothetical protein
LPIKREAKNNALDDAVTQINNLVDRVRCDRKCKKQKAEITMSAFSVSSTTEKGYWGEGYSAKASVGWSVIVKCSEP